MIFHEIYGSYFNVVAAVLSEAVRSGRIDRKKIAEIISEKGFGESGIRITDALSDGTWPFLRKDGSTAIKNVPAMPLTDLQKAWLNAVVTDPRVQLFLPETEAKEPLFPEVKPLYDPDFFVCFDRYEDGDPYEDAAYRERFRMILLGLQEKRVLSIRFTGKSRPHHRLYIPDKLEYSPKDDKFRLLAHMENGLPFIINLGRIESVQIGDRVPEELLQAKEPVKKTVLLELVNERNALERAMIHFSDLQKETVRLDRLRYQITLHYREEDETEILIRVLSFGPKLLVKAPDAFITLIRERLKKQKRCGQ